MQRHFLIFVSLGAVLALVSCSNQNKKNPQHQQAAQEGPAWELSMQSKCANGAVEQCAGFYGFTVNAQGRYRIGPAPAGQLKSGQVTSDELKEIADQLSVLLSTDPFQSTEEVCDATVQLDTADTMVITDRFGNTKTLLTTSEKGLCRTGISPEQADSLHKAIRTLMEQYYPALFPDACEDAIGGVESLYPALQACNANTDCGYITPAFEIVPPGTMEFIITDDCSRVRPLVVGNIGTVVNHQADLASALEKAQATCGQRIVRFECSRVSGFQSSLAPTCQNHLCQANQ